LHFTQFNNSISISIDDGYGKISGFLRDVDSLLATHLSQMSITGKFYCEDPMPHSPAWSGLTK